MLTLATQLNRIDTIPEPPKVEATSPRVLPPTLNKHLEDHAQLPRVDTPVPPHLPLFAPSPIPTSSLQIHSTKLKNARFKNTVPHNYPLRSLNRHKHNTGTNFRHLAAQHITAQHIFQPKVHHIFTAGGKKETIDSLLNSLDKEICTKSLSNEWGRLAQGSQHGVTSTDTIDFIHQYEVPTGSKVTYATYVVDYWPLIWY